MESYLMMLYVTLEQETALKTFFIDQGWTFCKPDLSVTTDKLGPAKITAPNSDRDTESIICVTGKRKAKTIPKSAPKVKLVKVLTGTAAAKNNSEICLKKAKKNQSKDISETASQDTEELNTPVTVYNAPVTVHNEDEAEENVNMIIKIERNFTEDEDTDGVEIDVGDENNDDTDTYDSMEVTYGGTLQNLDESELDMKSNTKRNYHTEDRGHKKEVALQEPKWATVRLARENFYPDILTTTDEDSEKNDAGDKSAAALKDHKTGYTCEVCSRKYLSKPTLQRHLKKHSCPFYCRSCSMAFNESEDQERHNREKHSQQFCCPQCNKYFKRKNSLSVHMEAVHMGVQRFPCTWPDCEKSFFRQDVLKDHINTHTGERPYSCQKCNKSYISKSSLNHHWRACRTNGLACKICGQVVEGEKIDGTTCTDNQEGVLEQLLSQSLHQSMYKCCICEKEIKIKYNMKRHLRTHLPGQINCIMCNQFFDSFEEKEEHMKQRHASRHICETCGVSFKRKSDLNAHMIKHEYVNEQEASPCFRCTYKSCRKIFFRQANYQYHLNKHSGEKPYTCRNCLKTFHSKYVKNEHEKDCLLSIKYECDLCDRVFKQQSGLHNHKQAEHIRLKKGYTCEVCSTTYKFCSGLIRHKKNKHQCLNASRHTENYEKASRVQLHSSPVPTKESEHHTLGLVTNESSNNPFIVVADMASEKLDTTPAVEEPGATQTSGVADIETHIETPGVADIDNAEIITTIANPVLEKSAEINIERVIVVHQVTGGLPEHLDGMND